LLLVVWIVDFDIGMKLDTSEKLNRRRRV